jgi:hypothetical protein
LVSVNATERSSHVALATPVCTEELIHDETGGQPSHIF